MKSLTASDRAALIRLAASLPVGDENRRAILAGLSKTSAKVRLRGLADYFVNAWEHASDAESMRYLKGKGFPADAAKDLLKTWNSTSVRLRDDKVDEIIDGIVTKYKLSVEE